MLNHKHENEKHKALQYTEKMKKICKCSGKLNVSPTVNHKDEIQKSQSHFHWRDIWGQQKNENKNVQGLIRGDCVNWMHCALSVGQPLMNDSSVLLGVSLRSVWKRLAFELVASVKWNPLPRVGGHHLMQWGLNRTKGRRNFFFLLLISWAKTFHFVFCPWAGICTVSSPGLGA